jgi:hypothetical protein
MIIEITTCAVLISAIATAYAWLVPADKSYEDAEAKIAAAKKMMAESRKRQAMMRRGCQ